MKPLPQLEPPYDLDAICRLAAEDSLDDTDLRALSQQTRRLMGSEVVGWYACIEGRETMTPLSLYLVGPALLGHFSLEPKNRTARVFPLRLIPGYEELRRPIRPRHESWREDSLGAVSLIIWLPPGAATVEQPSLVLREDVRQYPPSYDPDYILVDILADFADAFAAAFVACHTM